MNYCKYFIYACLVVGGTACSSEYSPGDGQPMVREVVFQMDKAEDVFTKATGNTFDIGDSIGVYAVRRTNPEQVALPGLTGNQAHNAKIVKTAEGWRPASLEDKIVFPQDGTKLDFYACYPYDRNARNPQEYMFSVKTEQDEETGLKSSDFLVARNTTGMNDGVVQLTFSHALAMVRVKVNAGPTVTPAAGLSVQMNDVKTGVVYDLGNDQLTFQETTGSIFLSREEDGDNEASFTYIGYVPAQTIPAETALFRCILGGKVYIYQSESVELTRGNRTLFELTLKSDSE